MSSKEINNNEKFAEVYEQLPQNVKDRLSFKNTERKPMATPWFNQGVTIMGPAGYFVAETQINREHARVDTYLALANAEFIVRACNSHDALVAALEDALLFVEANNDGGVSHRTRLANIHASLKASRGGL